MHCPFKVTVLLESILIGSLQSSKLFYRILFCFAVKKFHGLTSFLSFPEKLLRLLVTLPILGTLDNNIHGKTYAVAKRSAKTAKLFHSETKAIYGILLIFIPFL